MAFDGTVRLNEALLSSMRLTREQIQEGIKHTSEKVRRRVERFSQALPFPDLKGKTVFLVDDGLASGFTIFWVPGKLGVGHCPRFLAEIGAFDKGLDILN